MERKVKIRAFRACDDKESSKSFVEGHGRVLGAHGVEKVTSLNYDWIEWPSVFVILVESEDGEKVYGGARVHAYDGTNQLPVQEATGYMDPRIHDIVEREGKKGTGELCGLWNSVEVAGLGVGSFFATRAGVVICEQLGLSSLFALCAPYTVRWAERVGCQVLKEVGQDGTFYYPKIDLLATTVLLRDTEELEGASAIEIKKIRTLRENPQQMLEENPPGKRFTVGINYDLLIPNADVNEFKIK